MAYNSTTVKQVPEFLRAIPAVTGVEDPSTKKVLQALKENVEALTGQRGDEQVVLKSDLLDQDYIAYLTGIPTSIVNPPSDPGETPWGETPPPPTNLHVVLYEDDSLASPWFHHLEWDNPTNLENVWYIEVWSSTVDNISTATRIGVVTPPNNSIMVYGINLSADYYYWVRSVSYGYKHSTWEPSPDQGGYLVEALGTVGDTIDTILNILRGETPPPWDASITYYVGDTVAVTDGTNVRTYKCILESTNNQPPNETYWERYGILMVGDVAGQPTVGIDGNLVVDNTVLARHVAADEIEGYHILAGEIVVSHIGATDEILNANQEWTEVQNRPVGIQQIFYQATAPVADMSTGDYWIDTDDHLTYRYNGSTWLEVQDDDIAQALTDAGTAQATADGKIVTFTQTSAPTAEGVGDIWFDSDDGYRAYRWSGSQWIDIQDLNIAQAISDASDAQATADGKVVTFYQDSEPTADGVGDLWVDTNDTNKLYRWSGSTWNSVVDSDIAQAISDAADAQSTADGKIVTFYQTSAPTADGTGDIWFDTDDNNKPYRWSGSSWEAAEFDVATWSKISGAGMPDDNADVTADQFSQSVGDIDTATGRAIVGFDANGNVVTKVIPESNVSPVGAGLYLGADYMGYFDASFWKTYMDSSGNFYLGGSSGSLQWNASADLLTIIGNVVVTGGEGFAGYSSVRNGDFEVDASTTEDPTNWAMTYAGTPVYKMVWETSSGYWPPWEPAGQCYYANLDDAADMVRLDAEQPIPIDNTKHYCLSAWVRKVSGTAAMYLGFLHFDHDYSPSATSYSYPCMNNYNATDSWHRKSVVIHPYTETGESVRWASDCYFVKVHGYPQLNAVGGTLISRIQLVEGQAPTEWPVIDGGNVIANTITAREIVANTITATQIATGTITANEITSGTITVTEIYSLAHINGKQLNVYASGSTTVDSNAQIIITHNLGRYAIMQGWRNGDSGTDVFIMYSTTSAFTLEFRYASTNLRITTGSTVYYSYI